MCGTRVGKSQRIVRYSRPLVEDTMANQRVKRGRKVKLSTELGERLEACRQLTKSFRKKDREINMAPFSLYPFSPTLCSNVGNPHWQPPDRRQRTQKAIN